MKLFFHYCPFGFSNCYVLGAETGQPAASSAEQGAQSFSPDAILIDPGNMDEQILEFIESNNFNLRGVLVTHDHLNHVHGLRTLKRIYDAEIFAVNHVILDHKTTLLKDGEELEIGPFKIEVISVPGHSSDSAVYRIDSFLFTGDTLTAGLVGQTASTYGAAIQMNALRSRILSLPGDYTILPGHGPPSSLEAERRYNAGINQYDQNRGRRPAFRLNL
ncbi:MAG: MBL fold metallo-hydrolase [Treponema sp.]|jgi:glyoxylase-like metal-dependent hydrolase (beta-lactamase superfamily II)|nr:MBL fold metallo-hydrolase [Treponema sp.]